MIDPDLKYCPRCGDEYRAEIERCAACAVSLLSGQELLKRQGEDKKAATCRSLRPDDELVSIVKGPVVQMQTMQAVLKRAGIPSLAAGEASSCGSGGCGGPNLLIQIRKSDMEAAQAVLAREHLRTTGLHERDLAAANTVFDTAADSALCPACGCSFSTSRNDCPDCGLCFT
ncbi:MAG: zinc ribbon-containing (seleno)protein DG [Candidatus Electronema sp. VV]